MVARSGSGRGAGSELRRIATGAGATILCAATATHAQELAANLDVAQSIDTVIVTGTRGEQRTVQSSPAPVDVLSGEAIGQANRSNLLDALNTLLPSFNLPLETGDLNSMVRAGQLRGLNSSHTLVLVNGKRRHSTALLGAGGFGAAAPVDLGLIPSAAIKRIEVLRDGASAIYGSDAIAGVINIITDDRDSGRSFSYRDGQYFAGDGRSYEAKANAGFRLAEEGHVNVSAQFTQQDATNRTGPSRSSFLYYFPLNAAGQEILPAGSLSSNPLLPPGATANPREATRDNYAWKNRGIREFRLASLAVDAALPITNLTELYSFGSYSHRKAVAPQNFRHPSRDEVVRAIFPDGYTPYEVLDEDDYEVTAGFRGELASAWSWDVSSNYGRDKIGIDLHDSLNPTYGLDSHTDFQIGELQYTAWTHNLDLRKGFEVGWLAAPLQFSVGAEYRREEYQVGAGDPQSYTHGGQPILDGPNRGRPLGVGLGGAQALPGFKPQDAGEVTRNSKSLYAGLSLNPTQQWQVDLAARHESYSDFDDEVTARVSTRYDFNDRIAIRATASTGFQAPSLAAQAYRNTSNSNYYTTHVLQAGSPEAIALGAKSLKPETSTNYSLGFVLEPLIGVHLAIDLYQIDVQDRIAASTAFREGLYAGAGALVEAAGFGRDDAISYFINAADTRTRGVEATLDLNSDFGQLGQVRWSLALNHNEAEVTAIAPSPAILAGFNIPVFSQGSQNDLLYKSPKDKQVLGAHWSLGNWSVNLRETHYGSIQRWGTPTQVAKEGRYAGQTEIEYSMGDIWLSDFEFGYRYSERLSVALTANNLFDEKVSKYPAPLTPANMQYYYATGGPIDASGGFYAATVQFNW
jgi:iron complex outermembrane recepter protein